MTDDELRALVAANAQAIAETRAITDSNARAIAANANAISELRITVTQQGEQMMQGISEVVEMVSDLAVQQDTRHAESDQRFNNLLEDARADRQQADRDRALNESEHRAFRETFQTLLAEVARIWQRLAG